MKENEIIEEIHRVRAEHARECNYDVDVIFAEMREDLKRLQAEGWRVVSPKPREMETAYTLREEPPNQKPQP
jgi:phenylpyruvate tautomerase PptA (4-oxalocrotonate tautomerase family)